MKTNPYLPVCVALAAFLAFAFACEEKETATPPDSGADAAREPAPAGEHEMTTAGHGGQIIQLGTTAVGSFNVVATRDEGQIVAGKDAPIDVTVTPIDASSVKVVAVRFWIGTEDAQGSVRARAEIENPAEPNRWHTHAEIPNPLPAGSMLWVEIEDDAGGKTTGAFDLRM